MAAVTFNLDMNQVFFTYDKNEYDRSNDDLPTYYLKRNAEKLGGKYKVEYVQMYNELKEFKKIMINQNNDSYLIIKYDN